MRRGRLGLVLLLLLLALASLEIAFRISDALAGRDASFYLPGDMSRSIYLPHPALGVVLRPGWSREKDGTQIHINSLGMRGPEVDPVKAEGVFRIICLGASTTFGSGTTSDDRTYPARLGQLLDAAAGAGQSDGRRYEVLNAGVSGWNSADSLLNFELRLLELQPDAVIVYHAANDGRMIQASGFRADYSHMRQPPRMVDVPPLERFLLSHVRTYARLVKGTDPAEQLGALDTWICVPGWKQRFVSPTEWLNEPGLDVFVRNIENIVFVARGHGIEPVLSTFAVRDTHDDGGEGLGPFVAAANDRLRALAQRSKCSIVPVAEKLNDHHELYNDWIHFNDAGEERHARVVLDTLVRNGQFGLTARR